MKTTSINQLVRFEAGINIKEKRDGKYNRLKDKDKAEEHNLKLQNMLENLNQKINVKEGKGK